MIHELPFLAARRSVCAVTAGPVRATAWVISTKGLLATSHAALRYRVEVDIESEAGDRKPARVIFVDVGRDLALLFAEGGLPRGVEPMTPLPLRDAPPAKVGERVHLVSASPGRGLRISTASLCAVPRAPGSADLLDTDGALLGPPGGPLLDQEGRALGLLMHAASHRLSRRAQPGAAPLRALALPAVEVRDALRSLEASPEMGRRAPAYRCPTCTTPFSPEGDACLACGAPLPHPYPPNPAHAVAERAVRDALAAVGVVANRARSGPRSWQLPARGTPSSDPIAITVTVDEEGTALAFRAPVSNVPRSAREPFYRLLLSLNDQATGPFRLALTGERVVLVAALAPEMVRDRETGAMLGSLCETAEHYRKLFQDGFGAASLFTLDDPHEQ